MSRHSLLIATIVVNHFVLGILTQDSSSSGQMFTILKSASGDNLCSIGDVPLPETYDTQYQAMCEERCTDHVTGCLRYNWYVYSNDSTLCQLYASKPTKYDVVPFCKHYTADSNDSLAFTGTPAASSVVFSQLNSSAGDALCAVGDNPTPQTYDTQYQAMCEERCTDHVTGCLRYNWYVYSNGSTLCQLYTSKPTKYDKVAFCQHFTTVDSDGPALDDSKKVFSLLKSSTGDELCPVGSSPTPLTYKTSYKEMCEEHCKEHVTGCWRYDWYVYANGSTLCQLYTSKPTKYDKVASCQHFTADYTDRRNSIVSAGSSSSYGNTPAVVGRVQPVVPPYVAAVPINVAVPPKVVVVPPQVASLTSKVVVVQPQVASLPSKVVVVPPQIVSAPSKVVVVQPQIASVSSRGVVLPPQGPAVPPRVAAAPPQGPAGQWSRFPAAPAPAAVPARWGPAQPYVIMHYGR